MSGNVPFKATGNSFEVMKGITKDAFDCSWPEELFSFAAKPTAKLLHGSLGRFSSLMTSVQPTKLNRTAVLESCKLLNCKKY